MKADPLQIKSPKTALELLQTAIQLKNVCLARQCVENLDQSLDKYTVLMIYSYLPKCETPEAPRNNYKPSAPPIAEGDRLDVEWVQKLLGDLKHNCLLVIDKEADYILKQTDIVDLSYYDIFAILDRDSLEVSSEIVVYSAMYRWAVAECRRMTLNTHHVRDVLRQLAYTPRYGLMTKKEFTAKTVDGLKGPIRSGILDEKEWRLFKFYIEEKSKRRPVADLRQKMSQPRVTGTEKPVRLSERSANAPSDNVPVRKESMRGKAKCEECLINFLSCWSAVFD